MYMINAKVKPFVIAIVSFISASISAAESTPPKAYKLVGGQ